MLQDASSFRVHAPMCVCVCVPCMYSAERGYYFRQGVGNRCAAAGADFSLPTPPVKMSERWEWRRGGERCSGMKPRLPPFCCVLLDPVAPSRYLQQAGGGGGHGKPGPSQVTSQNHLKRCETASQSQTFRRLTRRILYLCPQNTLPLPAEYFTSAGKLCVGMS
jgi:hypothetical protein